MNTFLIKFIVTFCTVLTFVIYAWITFSKSTSHQEWRILSYISQQQNLSSRYFIFDISHQLLFQPRGKIFRATNSWSVYSTAFTWSPDESQIAFTSAVTGNNEIYLMDTDFRNIRQLTDLSTQVDSLDWSPDGNKIVFSASTTGSPEIYILNLQNNQITQLTFDGKNNRYPSWSPDGQYIAYRPDPHWFYEVSDTGLSVINVGGNNARTLLESYGGPYDVYKPTWTNDSHYLTIVTGDILNLPIIEADEEDVFPLEIDHFTPRGASWSVNSSEIVIRRRAVYYETEDTFYKINTVTGDYTIITKISPDVVRYEWKHNPH